MTKSKAALTYRAAKKKAWTEFSKYIRTRDCLQSTGRSYYGKCFTCGRIYEFELLQAGHFVGNRNSSILFDELVCEALKQMRHRYPKKAEKEQVDKLHELERKVELLYKRVRSRPDFNIVND